MHWADRTSVSLLRHLAGELERSRLLVAVTYRQGTPGPLSDALADLARTRNGTTIALDGLRPVDIHRAATTSQLPCGSAPAAMRC